MSGRKEDNNNKWKPIVTIQTYEERGAVKLRQRTPERSDIRPAPPPPPINNFRINGNHQNQSFLSTFKPTVAANHEQEQHSPPACPTPDYDSDVCLPNQSQTSQLPVKNSILKFDKNTKKTVRFGQNSTKEITPIKNHNYIPNNNILSSQDTVEMQSIESFELNEPQTKTPPKPPPTYFRAPPPPKDTKVTVKIGEYVNHRKEPNKLGFIEQKTNCNDYELQSELAKTLQRSNLRSVSDTYVNPTVAETNGKINNYVNGFVHTPSQNEIVNVRKNLKTFENSSNTVQLHFSKKN